RSHGCGADERTRGIPLIACSGQNARSAPRVRPGFSADDALRAVWGGSATAAPRRCGLTAGRAATLHTLTLDVPDVVAGDVHLGLLIVGLPLVNRPASRNPFVASAAH